tara:strand:+ start:1188 stop:1556 length:369 start_codon:yes stop_codon:yes gene_type:complete
MRPLLLPILRKKLTYFLVIAMFLLLISPLLTHAQIPGLGGTTFSGRILSIIYCTNGGVALIVGPPKGGFFLYQGFASRLYREYQLRIGPWVLGNYTPGIGLCLVGIFPASTQGLIRNIGTSF